MASPLPANRTTMSQNSSGLSPAAGARARDDVDLCPGHQLLNSAAYATAGSCGLARRSSPDVHAVQPLRRKRVVLRGSSQRATVCRF